ncbi:hypothetical protein [Cereibacter sphaeroides]|jgi:hypothetical protein|uniref:hypothetical protein n=1 Tax=Cereibacter sphaeroides TaxID=1063 RepID=UPI001B357F1F|nr:hypothetical protein [Cereibacter sphaeroides]
MKAHEAANRASIGFAVALSEIERVTVSIRLDGMANPSVNGYCYENEGSAITPAL